MRLWRHVLDIATRKRTALGAWSHRRRNRDPNQDADFAQAVVALGGKLAKADGTVTPDENIAFHQVFHAEGDDLRRAGAAFDLAGQTTLGFENYARRLARRWRHQPRVLRQVLNGLFHIAAADGTISDDELAYLRDVAAIFGLSPDEFDHMAASWGMLDAVDPHHVLGVTPTATDTAVRRAYRRLAAANHPDRFATPGRRGSTQRPEDAGSPASAATRGDEAITTGQMVTEKMATQKMAAINAAYHAVLAQRGMQRPGERHEGRHGGARPPSRPPARHPDSTSRPRPSRPSARPDRGVDRHE